VRNLTVIMVTHSAFAATCGHRTIELADGRIVRDVAVEPGPSLHLVPDALSQLRRVRRGAGPPCCAPIHTSPPR
jgi:ABC-type uncharacterized transport system ATPase component